MIGFGFREHGGPERLEYVDVPDPVPGPGEVRVRIRAASFNRLDLFTLRGIPGVYIARPHVLGSDGSGVVDAVGEGAVSPPVGTPVLLNPGLWDGRCEACRRGEECLCRSFQILGEHRRGTVAPFVVVPDRNVHPKPVGMSFEEAAAAPLVFQTAYRALRTVAGLRAGERCAIIGAGGAVAPAAAQVARHLGARVVVVTRSPEKAERVGRDGFEPLIIDEGRPLDRELWRWSGKEGVDVLFDSVGAPTVARSVRAIARGGRVVVIGATGGPSVELDLRTLFWRQGSIRGSTMATAQEFREVLGLLSDGRLRPVIDREYSFRDAKSALMRLDEPDTFGKVVVRGPE